MSPRILSRQAARAQRDEHPLDLPADTPPLPEPAAGADHPFFARVVTPAERGRVFVASVGLVRLWLPESRGPATDRTDAERIVGRFLEHLDSFPARATRTGGTPLAATPPARGGFPRLRSAQQNGSAHGWR